MAGETKCVATCAEHSGIKERLTNVETAQDKQWEAIETLQRRPPVWATATISLLTFLLGASLTYAGLVMRLTHAAGK